MHYFLILLFVLFPVFVKAQETPNAKIDVFVSQSAAQTGETIQIALRQTIREGWHTYWFNAGDSGEPIKINWSLPQNIEATPLQFPTPKRISYDPLVNFGYDGAPIYLQTVKIPDDFKGDIITFSGEATWLVCQEICIPESQNISFSLPIGSQAEKTNTPLFEMAQEQLPQIVDWETSSRVDGDKFILNVKVPSEFYNQMTDVEVYPHDWGMIKPSSDIIANINEESIDFIGDYAGRELENITIPQFVIKTENSAFEVTMGDSLNNYSNFDSLLVVIGFAFLGGLILNLMPCVFPILSMKALSLVKLSDKDRIHARLSGVSYTFGVVLSFLVIAGVLIAFKSAGATIGWGFQLQDPFVITCLAALLFLVGLNLSGFFEISGRFASVGSNFASGHGHKASFFTGVLATLVATPCTAPFMAPAIGFALTQSAFVALAIFAVLGFGLAFPYLLLTFIPAFQKILPRPGAWMDIFKQALAFPMFASVIWLIWVLEQQAGILSIPYILGILLGLVFLIWVFKFARSNSFKIAISLLILSVFIYFSGSLETTKDTLEQNIFTQDYLDKTLSENPQNPVFVNMTAAWCITCLVNERTSLSTAEVKNAFDDSKVIYIKGDWTNRNAEITKFLESYGRNGVPLYVYYRQADESGARPDPIVLPQILTPKTVLDVLEGDNND